MGLEEGNIVAVIRASRQKFRNSFDRAALVVHSAFLLSGFRLVLTGNFADSEDAKFDENSPEVGLDGWNEDSGRYAFCYLSETEGRVSKVTVKCLAVADTLMVDVLDTSSSPNLAQPLHTEIKVSDFVGDESASNLSQQFVNLGGLAKHLEAEILQKIGGGSATTHGGQSTVTPPHRTISLPQPGGQQLTPFPRFGTGSQDLDPMNLRGREGPGGGGMLLGPSDPYWRQYRGRIGLRFNQQRPPGVPPGARYDPIGPFGLPHDPDRQGDRSEHPIHPDLQTFRNEGPDPFL